MDTAPRVWTPEELNQLAIKKVANDPVNHPKHYTSHPSGVECIDITRHMTFNIGNAVKYCWRAGLKTTSTVTAAVREKHIEDLRKAAWYINDEITRLEALK